MEKFDLPCRLGVGLLDCGDCLCRLVFRAGSGVDRSVLGKQNPGDISANARVRTRDDADLGEMSVWGHVRDG